MVSVTPLRLLAGLHIFVLCSCCAALGAAEPLEGETAVDAGREALQGRTNYPWYDRQTDGVRPLNLAPESSADSANRQSKWKNKSQAKTRARNAGGAGASVFGPVLQAVGLVLLVSLLLVIAYLVARAFLRNEVATTAASQVIETSHEVDRVENLPFAVKRPGGDLLSAARSAYEAGNFSEAIVYLYSYYLIQLDKQHLIRLTKGKTNRQYVRELRSQAKLKSVLEVTMVAFEDVFFGHHALPREQFEACWQRLEEFQREIENVEQLAA